MKVTLALEARARNVALARSWVHDNCLQFGVNQERVDDIKIIVSEAVTNVVKHAYLDGEIDQFILVIKLRGNKLRVVIRDNGLNFGKHKGRSLHVGLSVINTLADKMKINTFRLGSKLKADFILGEDELRKPHLGRIRLINHF